LQYFTARLSRSRGVAQDAEVAKSTAFSFAAETPAKEKSVVKFSFPFPPSQRKGKINSLRSLRLSGEDKLFNSDTTSY
jgi:hypothetical protein